MPTSVVRAKPAPPPTSANGCPTSGSGALSVSDVALPARLLLDVQEVSPNPITPTVEDLTVKFHVSACNGRPLQGALVYAAAVPFEQFSVPPDATTGPDGWATLTLHQQQSFPVSPRQQILVMVVRARKAGENLLGGISTRRFFSSPAALAGNESLRLKARSNGLSGLCAAGELLSFVQPRVDATKDGFAGWHPVREQCLQ